MGDPVIRELFRLIESDTELQSYLRMSNVMAVNRMLYNDHGPVHAKIVAGSALEIFDILSRTVEPSSVVDGVCDYMGAKIIVLCGAYMHDLGNAVHRIGHEASSVVLASPILDRLLGNVYPEDLGLVYRVKSEILSAIYCSDYDVDCLSVEAGVVTVSDGTDMAEGRSRKPYLGGKNDIHSVSALAIKRVDIEKGDTKPVSIKVYMENPAGIFQVEEVIGRKLETSGIQEHVEVTAIMEGKEIKTV